MSETGDIWDYNQGQPDDSVEYCQECGTSDMKTPIINRAGELYCYKCYDERRADATE